MRGAGQPDHPQRPGEAPAHTAIKASLETRGYRQLALGDGTKFSAMPPGTFSFRMNVPVKLEGGAHSVNIPIDAVVMPKSASSGSLPIFFEAKSAGDFPARRAASAGDLP
jgi:type II restriction enzyme